MLRRGGQIAVFDGDYVTTTVAAYENAERRGLTVEAAEALKPEAKVRVEAGTFFGYVAYVSAIARSQPAA